MKKILKRFDKKDWMLILFAVFFIVVQVGLDLKIPEFMERITTLVQTGADSVQPIWQLGGWMILCAIGSLISSVIVGYFAARLGASFSAELRNSLYDKVDSFSLQEMNAFSTSSLITRSTNDITQLQLAIVLGLQVVIKAPILAVWAILKIAGKQWQWTMVTGITVVGLFVLVLILIQFVIPKFELLQIYLDKLTTVTRENLTGIRVVRAYNAENFEAKRFAEVNKDLTDTNLFTNRMMALLLPIGTTVLGGLNLAIYWVGAVIINNAGQPERLPLFSDMVVYSSYAIQVVMAFVMLVAIFILLPRARVSADRVNAVLDTEPSIKEGTKKEGVPSMKGTLSFQDVSFKYPDAEEYVLKDITFEVGKGQTIAFIGATGSGKSTLLNLIPRFYDTTEGTVTLDGLNVKEYRQKNLYDKIGYVAQQAALFSGTIASNISFGEQNNRKATSKEIETAVRIAQGEEFIQKLEDTFDSPVAQGGSNLSGGQKQRVAIARAIARKPEFLLFDDSFSALDFETDQKLRSMLKKETKDITTFIVAQRIGTIRDADTIIVLEEGRMVGIGTHDELMNSCAVYQEIASSQFSEGEISDV